MNQILREMFAFPFAHLDQLAERAAQRPLERRPGFFGARACSGKRITPGPAEFAIVISPGALSSFCNARIASW